MVELRKITEDNYNECLALKVSEGQQSFVSPNVYSLAQAWVYHGNAYPYAIYADNIMVGFIMMGYYAEKGVYDIWYLMIDEKFQRRGYGKAALALGVAYLKKEFDVKEIFLCFEPSNAAAEALYESAGFKRTGEVDGDEIIMRLDV